MCGIGGILCGGADRILDLDRRIIAVQNQLRHRGPDGESTWIDTELGVGLIHSRLAIIDVSPAGCQPMSTPDGRYTIVFNGEIYNFRNLRHSLSANGVPFTSESDTEVLLHLYARDGAAMVHLLAGMFAFAIWDQVERTIFLARDPLGIKPLYYWQVGETFAFASEVRALLAAELAPVRVDRDALARFLMMGSVQEPDSLVEGVAQLPAGCTLLWKRLQRLEASFYDSQVSNRSTNLDASQCKPVPYWYVKYGESIDDSQEAVGVTREALNDSIRRHFVSDVPVGIFLSGGTDSTAIVALAKANGFTNLRTFCISFDESEFNEGDVARKTAEHFGTEHTDWRMTMADAKGLLNGFLDATDLPSNDGFNTYCVSKLARDNGLKVVLSGLGGDELFGGYPSFAKIPQLMQWHKRSRMAGPFRRGVSRLANRVLPASWTRARRLAFYLQSNGGPLQAYWTMRSFFSPYEASQLVDDLTGGWPTRDPAQWLGAWSELDEDDPNLVGYLESTHYMRNQLLRDSDVMSMAHGLELRVPLADQRLYDAVNQIAPRLRFQSGKRLLLDAVPEVPQWIAERPKRGFQFPFEEWAQQQWGDSFSLLQEATAVPLRRWYRHWLLFTLNRFMANSKVQT